MSVSNVGGRRFYIQGSDTVSSAFDYLTGPGDRINTKWTINALPAYQETPVAFVDMGLNTGTGATARQEDWLSLAADGRYVMNLSGVEYLDAVLASAPNVDLVSVGKTGFTTNGSLRSIRMAEGNQQIVYLTAERDSSIFVGDGFDKITFDDNPDVAGRQFWAIVRREFGAIDAYNLYTGYRVRIEGGARDQLYVSGSPLNYGELEVINTFLRDGQGQPFEPGGDLPNGGNRGTFSVIDLSNEALSAYTDRFNSASFGSIKFSTQNLYVGEATVERFVTDNTAGAQSTPLALTSNGTKYLMVAEQASSIDGHLRLYSRNASSGMYNRFNEVFLGDPGIDNNTNNYSTTSLNANASGPNAALGGGATNILGTAMYGFGGNDFLTGGSDTDYLFGGVSTYSQLDIANNAGNRLEGRQGADYFGVGNISSGADFDDIMTTNFTARLQGAASGDSAVIATSLNSANVAPNASNIVDLSTRVATDVIRDWTYGVDYIRVLPNGTAIVDGLGSANGGGGAYTLDTIGDDPELIRLDTPNVVNEGKIVALGKGGNDTLWGSSGVDYLYGGTGTNLLYLNNDGAVSDRAYVDQFIGRQVVGMSAQDVVYLNVDVLREAALRVDTPFWLNPHGTFNPSDPYNASVWVKNSPPSAFTDGRPSEFGLDLGILNLIYVPWTETYLAQLNTRTFPYSASNGAWRNVSHDLANGLADIALGVAGGVAVAAGTAMIASIFLAGPGAVLVAFGASQIAAVITSEPHQNAQYNVAYDIGDYYVNNLTAQKLVNTTVGVTDTPLFTSFFWNSGVSTRFKKAVEFYNTANPGSSQAITSYMVVRSDDETFVYYVQSEDGVVTDDEARLVAELSGNVDISQFIAYKGTEDIYNQNAVAPAYPQDASLSADPSPIPTTSGRISDLVFTVTVTLAANPVAGDTIELKLNGTTIETFNAVASQTVYTRNVDLNALPAAISIQNGRDNSVNFLAISSSPQGFSTESSPLDYIVDLAPPEFGAVTALDLLGGTDDELTVTITGTGISVSESATVYLAAIPGVAVSVTESGNTVSLSVAPQAVTPVITTLRAQDAVGNVAVFKSAAGADVDIYVGTQQGDLYDNTGGLDDEIIFGFDGGDTLRGGDGSDQILGEDGNDSIAGNGGTDSLQGGAGDDTINGGTGIDTLIGGTGNDTFVYASSAEFITATGGADEVIDSVVGGDGAADTVQITGAISIGVTGADTLARATTVERLAAATSAGAAQAHTITLGSNAVLSDFRTIDLSGDSNAGSTGVVNMTGVTVGTTINGVATGSNTLTGGSGNDSLTGGSSADTLTGGGGNDTFNVAAGSDTITDLTTGDILAVSAGATATANNVSAFVATASSSNAGTATINAAAGGSTIDLSLETLGTVGYTVNGGGGVDIITGSEEADSLSGGGGNDVITGGVNDTITGGEGADLVTGGPGVNTFAYAATAGTSSDSSMSSRDSITGLSATDQIVLNLSNINDFDVRSNHVARGGATAPDYTVSVSTDGNFTDGDAGDIQISIANSTLTDADIKAMIRINATGTNGNDSIVGSNNDDTISGGLGNDSLQGDGGSDTIYGQGGNDTLFGGSSNDYLDGGADDDVINGGGGADTLIGGAGANIFQFQAGDVASGESVTFGGTTDTFSVLSSTDFRNLNAGALLTGLDVINIASGQTATFAAAQMNGLVVSVNGVGGGGAETLVFAGTTGADTIDVPANSVSLTDATLVIDAGDGADIISWDQTAGAVSILGGDGNDSIDEGGGSAGTSNRADTIDGGDGNDSVWSGDGADSILGGNGDDLLRGEDGADTMRGGVGSDSIDGGNSGDTIQFAVGEGAATGADTGYDTVTSFVTGTDKIELLGFADRDNNAARLMYETATLGLEKPLSANTELLLVTDALVPAGAGLAAAIAAALDSAYDLTNLATGRVAFAVRASGGVGYWVGYYNGTTGDDTVSASTEIEVLGYFDAAVGPDGFTLTGVQAPQPLAITMPSDTGPIQAAPGPYYTQSRTVSVNLGAGNQLLYSLTGAAPFTTLAANVSSFDLAADAQYVVGSIIVRQQDAFGNLSVTSLAHQGTASAREVITDNTAPSAPPQPDLDAADDVGVGTNTDNITTNTTGLTIQGVVGANATVELYRNGVLYATGSSDNAGLYSIDINLVPGSHSITAKVEDLAGNMSSPSPALSILVSYTDISSGNSLGSIGDANVQINNTSFGAAEALSNTNAQIHVLSSLASNSTVAQYASVHIGNGTISNASYQPTTKLFSLAGFIEIGDIWSGDASDSNNAATHLNFLIGDANAFRNARVFITMDDQIDNVGAVYYWSDNNGDGVVAGGELVLLAQYDYNPTPLGVFVPI